MSEIENFLLSVYRLAVLAVRSENQIERAAAIWRETLEMIDSAARQLQSPSERHDQALSSLDRILEIRSAASEMLALYA